MRAGVLRIPARCTGLLSQESTGCEIAKQEPWELVFIAFLNSRGKRLRIPFCLNCSFQKSVFFDIDEEGKAKLRATAALLLSIKIPHSDKAFRAFTFAQRTLRVTLR